jgi:V/A-type H+-transporting ATPase subunit E
MNAEQVVQKILAEANEQAQKMLSEAKAKAARQKTQLDSELADFETKTKDLAKAAAEDKLQRMLAGARMDNAKQLLAAKVDILNDVFKQAKKAVNDLPDEAYLGWVTAMIKQAVESGDEQVIVGKDETRINSDFLKKVNAQLGAGFKGNLRLAAQRGSFSGGFVLARGKVQINASTDVLVENLRESMQIELSQILFTDEPGS